MSPLLLARQSNAATHPSLVIPTSEAANLKIGELDSVVRDPRFETELRDAVPGAGRRMWVPLLFGRRATRDCECPAHGSGGVVGPRDSVMPAWLGADATASGLSVCAGP